MQRCKLRHCIRLLCVRSRRSSHNLAIVDISDPTTPTTVGNWDPNDTDVMQYARSVTVSGSYAYVAGANQPQPRYR